MPGERKLILIASSDKDVNTSIRNLLESYENCSYRVVEESGDVLLSVLEEDYDFAIIDLDIGGISGPKTVEIIKKSRPRLPLVIISGDASIEAGVRVMQHGVFYYMIKPVDMGQLASVIESALKLIRKK